MMDESRSWLANLAQRVTVPAAIAFLLGFASFAAGLLESMSLSNRKLGLGAVLVLAGLLINAGSEWRFHHEGDGWVRSIASFRFGALIVWFGMFMGATSLIFGPDIASSLSRQPVMGSVSSSSDEMCELLIGHRLHEIADLWTHRYAVKVLCQARQPPKQGEQVKPGEIVVTVSPANGQPSVSEAALLRTKINCR